MLKFLDRCRLDRARPVWVQRVRIRYASEFSCTTLPPLCRTAAVGLVTNRLLGRGRELDAPTPVLPGDVVMVSGRIVSVKTEPKSPLTG
ncbi:MAG: hypothetical protein Ct9H300mP7_5990 [Verrucomicrobiota bacterium]|nr:MAG: hypothetical protein Ct9H300mP7_5990 [Verrucomicrobiota bacterium]